MRAGIFLLNPYPDQLEVGVRGEASTSSFIAVRENIEIVQGLLLLIG